MDKYEVLSLKGWDSKAQGEALGEVVFKNQALKGRNSLGAVATFSNSALSGLESFWPATQGFALGL